MGPLTGYLSDKFNEEETFNALDFVKAYPSCLQAIVTVPEFGYFDVYEKYDNHEVYSGTCSMSHVTRQDSPTPANAPFRQTCHGKRVSTSPVTCLVLCSRAKVEHATPRSTQTSRASSHT